MDIPDNVMKAWLDSCSCCRFCNPNPCESVMAGGMCDHDCFCDDDYSDEDCWNCGGSGYSSHDCGEDCCVCLYPEDNVICEVCEANHG